MNIPNPFSQFKEKLLPKILWSTFYIALFLTFVLLELSINPILVILPLGLWFIFLISAEAYLIHIVIGEGMGEIQCSNCNKVIGTGYLTEDVYCDNCIKDALYFKQMANKND